MDPTLVISNYDVSNYDVVLPHYTPGTYDSVSSTVLVSSNSLSVGFAPFLYRICNFGNLFLRSPFTNATEKNQTSLARCKMHRSIRSHCI